MMIDGMANRLVSRVTVITGSAGGIGSQMAALFAAEGAAVVLADIADETGRRLAREITEVGGRAAYIHADVTNSAEVADLMSRTEALFGGLDVLVNNAINISGDTSITEVTEDVFDQTIAVCLKGPFLCTRHAIPLMKKRKSSSIVTISSVNALFGFGETAYTAAKGGLISMMRLVAAEYGEWNIRSNIICPGTIDTPTSMNYWKKYPNGYARLLEMYPLGRIGKPSEVAQYALFLASEESAFVNGSVCVIDGGLLAGRKFEV
jgi:NAD(P)-dependent dehydrogenase (short-subunit alcohol dehydrogenase family)